MTLCRQIELNCPEFYILFGTYFNVFKFISFYRFSSTSPISPSTQIDLFFISKGTYASPLFTQAYTALLPDSSLYPPQKYHRNEGFLVTRHSALEQPVVPLGIKQPLFCKACFLETMVYISSQQKIFFTIYKPQQIPITTASASSRTSLSF